VLKTTKTKKMMKSWRIKATIVPLIWYDKLIFGLFWLFLFGAMYVYTCTCSITNQATKIQLEQIYKFVRLLDYISIILFILGITIQKKRVLLYQQLFGACLLISVFSVVLTYFLLRFSNLTSINKLNQSLFDPQFSIKSWINLCWFSLIGLVNFALPFVFGGRKSPLSIE
jgi:predicted membrane channel-forming protein YqfA (hemolysin III family)